MSGFKVIELKRDKKTVSEHLRGLADALEGSNVSSLAYTYFDGSSLVVGLAGESVSAGFEAHMLLSCGARKIESGIFE